VVCPAVNLWYVAGFVYGSFCSIFVKKMTLIRNPRKVNMLRLKPQEIKHVAEETLGTKNLLLETLGTKHVAEEILGN
jgi:hypothetical protein